MISIERQALDLVDAAEFRELAEWARAVPPLLSIGSPNAKHYERIARILEDLAKLDELSSTNGIREGKS
jgi:hypothetical protein